MYISEALKTLRKVGYLETKDLNKNVEMQEAKQIVDENLEEYKNKAEKHKITAYAYLKGIQQIKQALYLNKTPVIICIDVNGNGDIELNEDYVAYIPKFEFGGGHALVCYG
jgi:hypothetical protein